MAKEVRYYVVNLDDVDYDVTKTEELFMAEAEKQGKVYSQAGFQSAFNNGDINSETDLLMIL